MSYLSRDAFTAHLKDIQTKYGFGVNDETMKEEYECFQKMFIKRECICPTNRDEQKLILAHVCYETSGLTQKVQDIGLRRKEFGEYYGRGPLQLTTQENYALVAKKVGRGDMLKDPGMVGRDRLLGWQAAAIMWRDTVHKKNRNPSFEQSTSVLSPDESADAYERRKEMYELINGKEY
eukprot:GHVO01009691.1.p1 GENE.GHVO01009691.1~~GHVO01009691.1.p1  ORF type:complete len:178 (+),score=27.60 GHVO01009691.1:252-785(+)